MLDAAMLPELDAPSRKRPSPESDNISSAQTSAPSSDVASESFVSATSGGSRSSTGTSSETEGSRKLRLRSSDDGSHVSCVGSSAGSIASSCVDGGGGSTDKIKNSSCTEKRTKSRVPAPTKHADGCIASRTRRSQASCSGLTSRTALEARDAFTQQRNNTPSASSTRRTKPTTAPVAAKVAPVTARVQTATLAVMGRNTGLNLELPAISSELLEVIEVESREEKQAAVHMHLSKNTFHEESQIVHERVFHGDHALCRTWVLIQPPTTSGAGTHVRGASVTGVTYLAAVTLRLNVYRGRPGRWAQVLNMSTRRERHGFGTTLIAGMEELLRREFVDIIVLYPADNGRAPAFWSTLGYDSVSEGGSLLPPEDVLEVSKGGSLVPEFESYTMQLLPRWEKRTGSPAGAADVLELCNSEDGDVPDEETKRASSNAREKRPKGALRSTNPKDSRLCGSRLWACTNSLLELRKRIYNRAS